MAKFKLQAGMELDLLTRKEVLETLQAWHAELVRGVHFRSIVERTEQVAAAFSATLRPPAGFVWSVTILALSGNGINLGADTFTIYRDEVAPSKLVASAISRQREWDAGVLVVEGPNALVVTGPATGVAGTDVFVTGAAIEVPEQLAWQLA
jgi:hypothetical protein